MKISVVSPSYNQADYIEATLLSVASQTYENKEHIVVDGGSTDGCIEIIKRFQAREPRLSAIIGPDRGQADAINKGLQAATGDILAWINTDDSYSHPEVFSKVARAFQAHPEADVIYGRGVRIDAEGKPIREAYINRNITGPESLKTALGIFQPSVFFRRKVFEAIGGLSEEYNLQLDYEYWIRMLKGGFHFHFLDSKLAVATVHKDAKSTRDRLRQLSECISMIGHHYGEVPDEWVLRFANFYATSRDEKVGAVNLSEREVETRDLVMGAECATLQAKGWRLEGQQLSVRTTSRPKRVIITSFDQKYFRQGISLIASLHRTSFFSFDEIHVYPLGLSQKQLYLLGMLEKVRLVSYPKETPPDFPDFYEPAHRAYKVAAISSKGCPLDPGTLVLWMDAGLACCSDVDEVFKHIENDEFFITDHDDSASWPFYNVVFMHRGAVEAINPSPDELLAPHLCSCIVGYRQGGIYQRLIDEAYVLGSNRAAVVWPKVPSVEEKAKANLGKLTHAEAMAGVIEGRIAATIDDLYAAFPYYGHRTQSIYSVLAYRYGTAVSSGKLYHKANKGSQKAAHSNWLKGADKTTASRTALEGVQPGTRVYQHRGLFDDQSGLIFRHSIEPVAILGNGPSLRGLDFQLLKGRKWLGMNAAYRYWDEIGVYPYIYSCLDEVVLKSHQEEIRRLIEKRKEYGIRWFFLRRAFLDYWPEAETIGGVLFLEDLQRSVEWFDRGKITTGSFSLYFCCFLGFSEIYISGVDLEYVEQVPEAAAEGRELVIKKEVASNPNYFFDGYQKPGDRYNPPNRYPDMHLRSWNEAAEVLADFPVAISNCNPKSAVRVFPFVNRDRAIATMASPHLEAMRVADRATIFSNRQTYWRRVLMERIGAEESSEFKPDEAQTERFGQWLASSTKRHEEDDLPEMQSGTVAAASTLPPTTSSDRAPGVSEATRGQNIWIDESAVVSLLSAHTAGKRHVMLDVGAHYGSSAAYFDKLGWTIHCFEPDAKNREKLTKRFAGKDNVTIDARAVSDKPATGVSFFRSEESTGISGLSAFRDTHHESGKVDVTTITEVVRERGIDRVDFLKIDVEGFDFAVLKGVPWERLQPDVIECEFEDLKTVPLGHTYKDMAQFLVDKGYTVYLSEWHPIVRYGIRHDWRRLVAYPAEDVPADAWGNMLAFRTDPGIEALTRAFDAVIARSPAEAGLSRRASKQLPVSIERRLGQTKKRPKRPKSQALSKAQDSPKAAKKPQASPRPRTPYARFARWARKANPLVYRAGQFTMWCLRVARRNVGAVLGLLAVEIALIAASFLLPAPIWPVVLAGAAVLFAAAAAVVAVAGFAGHLVRRSEIKLRESVEMALRKERARFSLRLRKDLKQARDAQRAAMRRRATVLSRASNARFAQLSAGQDQLSARQKESETSLIDRVHKAESQLSARQKESEASVLARVESLEGRLSARQQQSEASALARLKGLESQLSERQTDLLSRVDGLESQISARQKESEAALLAQIEDLEARLSARQKESEAELRAQIAAAQHLVGVQAEHLAAQAKQAAVEAERGLAAVGQLAPLTARLGTLEETVAAKEASLKASFETLSKGIRAAEPVMEARVAAVERQLGHLKYPSGPRVRVFFGHHKCASRFFRYRFFHRVAAVTGAEIRRYEIKNPPFHYSRMDELDLFNIDFENLEAGNGSVVLFANASERSLAKIREATGDWKALRVIRDPRQVLVSDYFHHRSKHDTEMAGWVWDDLVRDKPILNELPQEEGLLYELDHISRGIIEEQILAPFDDDRVLTIKLEDFEVNPESFTLQIAEFLEVPELSALSQSRVGENPAAPRWRDYFTDRVTAAFKERYGQALIDLGYESSLDWAPDARRLAR